MGMLKSCVSASSNSENGRNAAQIEQLLEVEASNLPNRNWPRLDNTERAGLLRTFAEAYCKEEGYEERTAELTSFLLVALTRKRLSRVKDVEYDKAENRILRIYGLSADSGTKRFALQRAKPTVRSQN